MLVCLLYCGERSCHLLVAFLKVDQSLVQQGSGVCLTLVGQLVREIVQFLRVMAVVIEHISQKCKALSGLRRLMMVMVMIVTLVHGNAPFRMSKNLLVIYHRVLENARAAVCMQKYYERFIVNNYNFFAKA